MKKTILFLALIMFSIITMRASINTVADSGLVKQEVPKQATSVVSATVDVDNDVPGIAYVIPLSFFAFVLLIIGISQYYNYKKNKDRVNLYMKYLELGKEVPANLLLQQKDGSANLKRGIILMAVGVGVCIFFFAQNTGGSEWTMGLIPFLIGVGYLIVYKISPKAGNNSNE